MSKDKIYGWGIAIIFFLILVVYTVIVPYPILLDLLGESRALIELIEVDMQLTMFFLMGPVYLGVLLFSIIVMWIGYTMATTPPPEPIDLDSLDLDDEETEGEEATTE